MCLCVTEIFTTGILKQISRLKKLKKKGYYRPSLAPKLFDIRGKTSSTNNIAESLHRYQCSGVSFVSHHLRKLSIIQVLVSVSESCKTPRNIEVGVAAPLWNLTRVSTVLSAENPVNSHSNGGFEIMRGLTIGKIAHNLLMAFWNEGPSGLAGISKKRVPFSDPIFSTKTTALLMMYDGIL